jgi:hypothetical protein
MSPEEIESLVKSGRPLPEGLNIAEINYYMALEYLARDNQSKEEKARRFKLLRAAFEDAQRWIGIYKESFEIRLKLAGYSKEVESGDCERCKQMMRIFDGRTL